MKPIEFEKSFCDSDTSTSKTVDKTLYEIDIFEKQSFFNEDLRSTIYESRLTMRMLRP